MTKTTDAQDLIALVANTALVKRQRDAFLEKIGGDNATDTDILRIARDAAQILGGGIEAGAALVLPQVIAECAWMGLFAAPSRTAAVPSFQPSSSSYLRH